MTEKQKEFIYESLNKPKELKLLFRASEHGFRGAAFHEKCDNTPDTLTIVRTEFGKTVAGFTHYTWNQVNNNAVNDSGRRAFLLQLDLLQKMVPVSDKNLIYCHTTLGPAFGGGSPDIWASDNCNTSNTSWANFPTNYNVEGPNKYTNSQASYTAMCGATNGYNFKVTEY